MVVFEVNSLGLKGHHITDYHYYFFIFQQLFINHDVMT